MTLRDEVKAVNNYIQLISTDKRLSKTGLREIGYCLIKNSERK